MKSAIYLNEGVTQVVLTPENEWEKNALRMIADSAGNETQVFWDNYYECRGGWYRHGQTYGIGGAYGQPSVTNGSSLMFRINKKVEVPDVVIPDSQ